MKYEVIKLRTGSEICGMIKDMDEWIEITLPMICQLTKVSEVDTMATFIPYAPLSRDSTLTIARDDVMHRSNLNEQFIPFYDEASSKWLTMVETASIPLSNQLPPRERFVQTIDDMLSNMTSAELDELDQQEQLEDILPFANESKLIH